MVDACRMCNDLRAQPNAFLHFLDGEFIAPSRLVRVRQIGEQHRRGYEAAYFFENLSAGSRDKAIAHTSHVDLT
jgi:hypothetical protein